MLAEEKPLQVDVFCIILMENSMLNVESFCGI